MVDRALYADYLKSDEWAARREKVMQRAGGICEGCRQRPATEVHHLSYEHVTQEFLFELVAMCGGCHARWHGQPTRPTPAWTPKHTGRTQDKPSPSAQAARGRLSVMAANARAKFMAAPVPSPPMATQERMKELARRFHDDGDAQEQSEDVSRETGDAA